MAKNIRIIPGNGSVYFIPNGGTEANAMQIQLSDTSNNIKIVDGATGKVFAFFDKTNFRTEFSQSIAIFSTGSNPPAAVGGLYYNTTDNNIYRSNGSTWSSALGAKGDVGPTGSPGPKGPTGSPGGPGDQGNKGSQGNKGDTGSPGGPGPTGSPGGPGDQGNKGNKGGQGNKGDTGSPGGPGDQGNKGNKGGQGNKGDTGSPGGPGNQGNKGDKGEIGPPGPQGNKGDKGEIGTQGNKGDTGSPGPQGNKGEIGTQGNKGDTGSPGGPGAKGPQGSPGGPGAKGPQGSPGGPGAKGPQGNKGDTGSPGGPGAKGPQGNKGSKGEIGTQGNKGNTGSNAGITSYTNAANNRVITSVDSTTINAEANLTFDGTTLYVNGALGVGTATPTTTGLIRATNDVVAYYSSDERLKTNKVKINNPLDKLSQINGYEFDWIPVEGVHENEGHDIGIIAQEIEKVLPEVVTTRDNGYKAVKYEKLVALLIEIAKQQQQQIDYLLNKEKDNG